MTSLVLLVAARGALAQEPQPQPSPAGDAPDHTAATVVPADASNVAPGEADAELDASLLRGLLQLLSADGGVRGAEALGMLGDPRAVWALEDSVEHRPQAVAQAAAWALGSFPEAAPALAGWVRDITRPDVVRVAAAQALGRLGQPEAADTIVRALGDRTTSESLRAGLREVLAKAFPDRLAEADQQVRRSGTAWLMAGGAAGTGYALAATGHFGQSGLEAVGAVTGGMGGATLGWVLGRTQPMEGGQAAFLSTSGIVGLTGGTMLGPMLAPGDEDMPWITGLLGGVVGYGAGIGLHTQYRGNPEQAAGGVAVGATSAVFLGSTATFLDQQGVSLPDNAPIGFAGLGLLGGTAIGQATTSIAGTDAHDAGTIVLAGSYGTFVGAVVPLGGTARSSLPLVGMSGGALLAYGLSPVVDLANDVNLGAGTGVAFGAIAGWGAGKLARPRGDDTMRRATTLLAGTAGGVLGGALAARTPGGIEGDDVVITTISTGWATWQVNGWMQATHANPDLNGLRSLVPAAVGGATAIASPRLNVRAGDSLCATSLGAWGGYLGAVSAQLAHTDSATQLGLALATSDAGLLGGALLMSPLVHASPTVVGVADAGGVLGGSTAALITTLFTADNTDVILAASLVGSGLGAGGGALVGRSLDRSAPEAQVRLLPRLPAMPQGLHAGPAFLPTDGGGAWGARMSLDGW